MAPKQYSALMTKRKQNLNDAVSDLYVESVWSSWTRAMLFTSNREFMLLFNQLRRQLDMNGNVAKNILVCKTKQNV